VTNSKKPRSIEIPGVTHGATPIPAGARVGNMVFSSGIMGKDPATDTLPAEAEAQARFAFANMQELLRQAGATLADIGHMKVYVKHDGVRAAVNAEWLKCFPDPHDRPARHTVLYDLQGGMLLQLEIIAVVT
jgi:2-iminobutanoate/2-iminopropanoate deaminase